MEKMREEFEKYYSEFSGQTLEWVKSKRYQCERYTGYETGCGVQPYWMMWQASREAIEIVLPDPDAHDATWQYKDAVEGVISEAGLKVRSE